MEDNVYTELICSNCLQKLLNNEGNHTEKELKEMQNTLSKWREENYLPLEFHPDLQGAEFSNLPCNLCNAKAGDRYLYNFIDKSVKNEE